MFSLQNVTKNKCWPIVGQSNHKQAVSAVVENALWFLMEDKMDSVDFSSEQEFFDREKGLFLFSSRPIEKAILNIALEKVCLDCGVIIPEPRTSLAFVVRCLECQTSRELEDKRYA